MNQITDKLYCIITNYGNKIYINETQFNSIYNNFDSLDSVKIAGVGIINKRYIVMVGKANEIEDNEKERKGDWKCGYGHWHKKGEQCGHGELAKYDFNPNQWS